MDLRERHAEIALRLLLAQDDQAADLRPICVGAQLIAPLQLERVDWDVLLELARENRITIRLYDRLQSLGIQPSVAYQEYVCRERVRIHRVIELMRGG